MKKALLLALACAAGILSSCLNQSGAVSQAAVEEMLASPRLAVTPFLPAWLHDDKQVIQPLSEPDRQRVCAILLAGEHRHVPELAYQTDDERNPLSRNRFYVYASNAQCLAATLLEERVAMHDVLLTEPQERELYQILRPYLRRLFAMPH